MNIRKMSPFLISVLLVLLCTSQVFAIDMFSPTEELKYGVYQSDGSSVSVGGSLRDFNEILKTARTEYCKKFQACAEDKYANKAIIGKVEIESNGVTKEYPITNKDFSDSLESESDVSGFNDTEYEVKIGLSDSYNYTFQTYNIYMSCVVGCSVDDEGKHHAQSGVILKSEAGRYQNLNPHAGENYNPWSDEEVDYLETLGGIGENTISGLQSIADAARLGLIAGSVGSGYNVGTIYSNNQISLSNAMEKQDNGYYDFKSTSGLKSTFEYYMNPLLGKVDFLESNGGVIPSTVAEWTVFMEKSSSEIEFIQGYEIILNPVFDSFESSLSDDGRINSQGLKKTENVSFSNGVSNIKDISTSRKPKSVISYNMKIALPYIFYQSAGDRYKLDMNQLRVLDGYTYCVSNNFMYQQDATGVMGESIGNINTLELSRDQLFIYKYVTGGYTYGVILVGQFHEGILDTTTGLTYATGRNIAFNNGYSDMLTLNSSNANLMYSIGSLSNRGRSGFLPVNVAFPVSDEEVQSLTEYQQQKDDEAKPLELSNTGAIGFVEDKKNHVGIGSPKYFKIVVGFEELKNHQEVDETTESSEPSSTEQIQGGNQKGFVIYWNNYYVNEADLLSWLRSNEAHSITYVDADTLIAKITGDFTDDLEEVSYDTWQKMKDIRHSLENRKENKWVSGFSILSMCMGIFCIIVAILLCLAYWVDIFNTFVDFSILHTISFGNMYPVWDKEITPHVAEKKGATHFVTFPQVLARAFALCVVGCFLLNITKVMALILFLYQYILSVFVML